jgi:hypothetical protein
MQTPTHSRRVLSSGQPHKQLLKTRSVGPFLLQLVLFMVRRSKFFFFPYKFLGFLGGITVDSVRAVSVGTEIPVFLCSVYRASRYNSI